MPADSLKAVVPRGTQDQRQERDFIFSYRAITFCGIASQQFRLTKSFVTFLVNYVSALQPQSRLATREIAPNQRSKIKDKRFCVRCGGLINF